MLKRDHLTELERSVRETLDYNVDFNRQQMQGEAAAEEKKALENTIDLAILDLSKRTYISAEDKLAYRKQIFHMLRGYDCMEEILQQDDITEVMINGYQNIFVERNGRIEKWNQGFSSEEKYMDMIQKVVAKCNRYVNETTPIADAHMEDGSRVNIVLPPVAVDGPTMTIRRFPKETYNIWDLVDRNMMSKEVGEWLACVVKSKYNLMISGGTGSGKTTLLNALANQIPGNERVITIEDSIELQIRGIDNLVRMEVRNANLEGTNGIPMNQLIKCALRMRPDRIIVGEVRGKEALDMLQAMNTGHDGSLSTGHANSVKDITYRLETMVLMNEGMDLPLHAIRQQIVSAIDFIIQIGRLRDGKRRLLEIAEVTGFVDGEVQIETIWKYVRKNDEGEESWIKSGEIKNNGKMV